MAGSVIPAAYSNFLVASTQASAALIGLLFVSVSISPERVFGREAEAGRQALALSAFTALANVFFISFGALIPNLSFGVLVVIASVIAASQTLALLASLPSWRREGILLRSLALFGASAAIYGFEIVIGVRLISSPTDSSSLTVLFELLLGGYSIGLARAWQLLGAREGRGIISGLWARLRSRSGAPAADVGAREHTKGAAHDPENRA
jgi:hypothetical protein